MRIGKLACSRRVVTAAAAAALVGLTGAACSPAADGETPSDRFTGQQVSWRGCDDERLDKAGAQCADITVPLDYAAPQGETMTVAISRISATDPARRRGIMLSNSGGPGGHGLDFMIDISAAMTPDVRARYDLIGMDPRGVGRSTPVNCDWPRGFGLQSAGPDAASYAETVATQADLAARCAVTEGDRLRHITTRNTARDMDLIRTLLGEERTSYFGTSYGTYLGAVYLQMFPERADRFVLDSAVDPARYGAVQMLQDMGPANEAATDSWADWTAAHDGEYHLGATREAVRATVSELVRRAGERPIRFGEFDLTEHEVPLLLFTTLDDPRNYATAARQIRLLADAAAGRAVELEPELSKSLAFLLRAEPQDNSAQMAIMCGDVAANRDPAWYWRNIEAARATQPLYADFANSITPCAFWPDPAEPATVVDNAVPALIVQSTGDTRTTYANAQGMRRALTGSRMVTLENVAIHHIFGRYPNACVYNAVNAYLRDGTLPESDYSCREDS
ncbi:alpha/beta hydrolase [Nocardia sp. IFM 10818]